MNDASLVRKRYATVVMPLCTAKMIEDLLATGVTPAASSVQSRSELSVYAHCSLGRESGKSVEALEKWPMPNCPTRPIAVATDNQN
jgi:hypothetical protein